MTPTKIQINRAPVLTLWAVVAAERLGFNHDEALSLGKAVAGLTAQSKGRRLGIFKPTPKDSLVRERERGEEFWVELLGRHPLDHLNQREVTGHDPGISRFRFPGRPIRWTWETTFNAHHHSTTPAPHDLGLRWGVIFPGHLRCSTVSRHTCKLTGQDGGWIPCVVPLAWVRFPSASDSLVSRESGFGSARRRTSLGRK